MPWVDEEMNSSVIVRNSKIHGKGVFARREIKKGEVVIDWSSCSKVLNKKEVDVLSENKKRLVSYQGSGKYVLFHSPGRYINHSCDSNTKAIRGRDVAVRNIKKGEEITADYIAEKVPGLNLQCKCGSKKCKGRIKF